MPVHPSEKRRYLEAMRKDIALFASICLKETVFERTPDLHKEVYDSLQSKSDDMRKILAVLPRGHGKTTIAGKIFPLHTALYATKPEIIVLVSKTQGHAKRLLRWVKEKLNSKAVQFWFGDYSSETAKSWASDEIILKNNVMIVALGMGQQIRGITHSDARPTIIILDDPEDDENTRTEESMSNNLDWLLGEADYALDPHTGKLIVIGTTIRDGCMVMRLRASSGWHTIWKPAITNFERQEVLWPERFSFVSLMNDKRNKESIGKGNQWAREMQLEIQSNIEQIFKPDDIKPFEYNGTFKLVENRPWGLVEIGTRKIPVNVFMGVDPASSLSKRADNSVVFPIGMCAKGHIYCLPYFRDRIQPMQLGAKIIDMGELYRPIRARVESVQFQEMLRQYVYDEMRKRALDGGHWISGLDQKVLPRGEKTARLEGMQHYFMTHRVHLLEGQEDFYRELTTFPRGTHDDTLDGFYLAVMGAYPCDVPEYSGDAPPTTARKSVAYDWQTGFPVEDGDRY